MKRTFSSLLLSSMLFGMVAFAVPQPAQAQSFNIQETFNSITSGVQQQFRKIYLALPGEKSAEAVLEQNALAMQDVSTVRHQTEVDVRLLEAENELMALNLDVSGPTVVTNVYDPTSAQQDLQMNIEVTMEGSSFSGNADVKVDGETIYFKANQVPAIPFLQLNDFKEQWIKFENTQPALEDTSEGESVAVDQNESLTADQRSEIKDAYISFIQDAQLSAARKERVDGFKVFVIDMTFTGSDLAQLMERMAEIKGEEIDAQDAEQTQQALANVEDITATVMIDRDNYYLRKIEVPVAFSIPEDAASTQVADQAFPINTEAADRVEINITSLLTDYNQPVEFSLPAEVVSAEELMTRMMGGSGAFIPEQAEVDQIDQSTIPVELEALSAEERALLEQYGIEINGL